MSFFLSMRLYEQAVTANHLHMLDQTVLIALGRFPLLRLIRLRYISQITFTQQTPLWWKCSRTFVQRTSKLNISR